MRILGRWSLVATLILCAPHDRADAQQTVEPSGTVLLRQSESFTLRSHANGTTYQVFVGLPSSYAQEGEERYPVLYAVDADAAFASMVEISRLLAFSGEMPEIIVVGIGYGTDLASWRRLRQGDLNPQPPAEGQGSAGVSRFLDFITGEVIPLVEGRYRSTGDRTFFGYSLAGLFGTWVRPTCWRRTTAGADT